MSDTQPPEPFRMIAPDGTPTEGADPGLDDDRLRELLRLLILARKVDDDCMALQRQGELTVYPPFRGQEAAQIGSATALGPEDWVFPSFRELAAAIARGVDVVEYLHYHRGTWHGGPYDPFATRFAPICVPVATQIPHAVGYAIGAKLDGRSDVALAYFGDGSASEGDFHEACNLAAVFEAPVVLLCQNNAWAISVPFARQAAAPIWRRAAGYGFPGVQVDGNDVLAVHAVTRVAVERARSGGGPTLIEAVTYRMGPHTTADDPGRYRDPDEVARWESLDPIVRYRAYLLGRGVVDAAAVEAYERESDERVREIRDRITRTPPPPPDELFAFAYGAPPTEVLRQRDEALGSSGGGGA